MSHGSSQSRNTLRTAAATEFWLIGFLSKLRTTNTALKIGRRGKTSRVKMILKLRIAPIDFGTGVLESIPNSSLFRVLCK